MNTQPDFFTGTKVYRDHAGYQPVATSIDAAKAVTPGMHEGQRRVLHALKCHGPRTPDELAERLYISILYVRPRCTELLKAGLIERTGERRKNGSGLGAYVLRCK